MSDRHNGNILEPVTFIRSMPPYNAGEQAGFPPARVLELLGAEPPLVRRGHGPAPAEPVVEEDAGPARVALDGQTEGGATTTADEGEEPASEAENGSGEGTADEGGDETPGEGPEGAPENEEPVLKPKKKK